MAKQARIMFDSVRSCRFVFTATITSAFNRMIRGHIIAFTVVLKMNTATTLDEASDGSKEGRSAMPQGSNVMEVVWFIVASRLTNASDIFRFLLVHKTKLLWIS